MMNRKLMSALLFELGECLLEFYIEKCHGLQTYIHILT